MLLQATVHLQGHVPKMLNQLLIRFSFGLVELCADFSSFSQN